MSQASGNEPTVREEKETSLRERLAEKNERLRRLRTQLEDKNREIEALRGKLSRKEAGIDPGDLGPENVIWIFGSGRSGSTWLASMMKHLRDHSLWHEPLVGALFGEFYYVTGSDVHYKSDNFILGRHRESWSASIRSFVLEGIAARFPEATGETMLVVKEPNGSAGAPLLTEALPESRMIFLVRDPRDVVASGLDARREGSWFHTVQSRRGKLKEVDEQPDEFVKARAERYLRDADLCKSAFEAHRGPKSLVRYEELRVDTLGTMKRLYSELGIPVDMQELARTVREHSWENIPDEGKGEGKFYRKATPGSWHEDLTPEQARMVEEITAPVLEAFYA